MEKVVGKKGNKTGKGGFGAHPENINRAGAPLKNDRFADKFLIQFSEEELIKYLTEHIKKGSDKALLYTLDRIYGKVKEQLELPQLDGIKIIFEDIKSINDNDK